MIDNSIVISTMTSLQQQQQQQQLQLQQQQLLQQQQQQQQHEKDCMQCKIVGVMTFSGLASYSAYLRMNTPRNQKMQRVWLGCVSVGSIALAVWRTTIWTNTESSLHYTMDSKRFDTVVY